MGGHKLDGSSAGQSGWDAMHNQMRLHFSRGVEVGWGVAEECLVQGISAVHCKFLAALSHHKMRQKPERSAFPLPPGSAVCSCCVDRSF